MKFQKHMEHNVSTQKHEDFACFIQHIVLEDTSKEGLDFRTSSHPAALFLHSATGTNTQWQQSQPSRGKRFLHSHHVKSFEIDFNMAGTSRRRLSVFVRLMNLHYHYILQLNLSLQSLLQDRGALCPFFLMMSKV